MGVETEAAVTSLASKATWGGGITASVVGALRGLDWVAIIGATVAIGGMLINWYYKREQSRRDADSRKRSQEIEAQRLKMEADEHAQRMKLSELEMQARLALLRPMPPITQEDD